MGWLSPLDYLLCRMLRSVLLAWYSYSCFTIASSKAPIKEASFGFWGPNGYYRRRFEYLSITSHRRLFRATPSSEEPCITENSLSLLSASSEWSARFCKVTLDLAMTGA